jgi:hydrogenase-4 component B
MLDLLISPTGLGILFAIFGIGMVGSLILRKNDKAANAFSSVYAIAGSVWGLAMASSILATGREIAFKIQASTFTDVTLSLHVDKLAAFFMLVISLVAIFCSIYGVGYIKEYYKRYNIGAFGFFYNAFIFGMLLVVSAADGLLFMTAWEIMSLASFFLVIYDHKEPSNIRSGYIYLVMTHIGAACITLAMFLLFNSVHSLDFAVIKDQFASIPQNIQFAVIGLTFLGLGAKAGIIPFHIWLPSAHPAAPSHVSALMSGVMIKTAIYMMIRLYIDMFQPISIWWGVAIIVVGAISALLGVMYALTEKDIKRLLAYSSIENIGIILLGLGSALVFSALGREDLMIVALVASLLHTLNHSLFKSLLFMGAGSIIQAMHTRNMEKYGGLIKVMPYTAFFFLIGALAISAIPPFNGFYGEWLTFQSLFSGIQADGYYVTWVFILAAGALAVTGGLALACFVKAFGITFLARPRTEKAASAKESSLWMKVGMGCVAVLCLAAGVGSGAIVSVLQGVAQTAASVSASMPAASAGSIAGVSGGASVSGLLIVLIVAASIGVIWLIIRYGVYKNQQVRKAPTWDCGTKLNGRMEITATGFSRS